MAQLSDTDGFQDSAYWLQNKIQGVMKICTLNVQAVPQLWLISLYLSAQMKYWGIKGVRKHCWYAVMADWSKTINHFKTHYFCNSLFYSNLISDKNTICLPSETILIITVEFNNENCSVLYFVRNKKMIPLLGELMHLKPLFLLPNFLSFISLTQLLCVYPSIKKADNRNLQTQHLTFSLKHCCVIGRM